jgi:cytochrome P450
VATAGRQRPKPSPAFEHVSSEFCDDMYAPLTKTSCSEAAEIILDIVYNYTIEPHSKDPLVAKVNEALEQFSVAAIAGRWAVDMLPVLEYLPEWLPGSGFKETARQYKQTLMEVVNVPYNFAKDRMSSGEDKTSFVAKSIEQARKENNFDSEAEHLIKWSATSMYAGGADTSVSTMVAFFLAMSMFPDVQRKAQEEIDRVVGTSRLPTAGDRENLPYINAVVEEAQRWHPIAPLGLPHVVDEEDSIDGFRLPKGAMILPSIWWFTRDPETYHDPEEFKPERFLAPYNEPSASNVIFGFGRRICPGKALADASLYLTFAQSLAAFKIEKAVDDDGLVVEPKHTFGPGIVAHPGAFDIRIEPRSSQSADLVAKVVEDHPWKDSDAQHIHKARV